jgi:hypothetical protein
MEKVADPEEVEMIKEKYLDYLVNLESIQSMTNDILKTIICHLKNREDK